MSIESTVSVKKTDQGDIVSIVGPVDEEIEGLIFPLAETLSKNILIDFKNTTTVNSLGVRSWINFMRKLEGRNIFFTHCTSEIVNQINMIPSFLGSATVVSVYGGFSCEDCSHTTQVLYEKGKNLPQSNNVQLAPQTCEKCGSKNTEFEEVEESYFSFNSAA